MYINTETKLPLPIGVTNYRLASTEYYYVDKTMMIKDFIDDRPMVSLYTRPRRFGKTLNMDMLRTFFEKTDEDTSIYFTDKKIWSCGERYQSYQGRYPVIFLTFKDVKFNTWNETFSMIRELISKESYRHKEVQDSKTLDDFDRKAYQRLLDGHATESELTTALADLSRILHKYYGIAPIIIIDEYDTPIHQGYLQGYYDKIILFMRNLFSGGLKDNTHLSYGFLTGILRVAQESIFSGLNNIVIYSVLDNKYSTYFGFTSDEVKTMAAYYGVSDKYHEICEWYDGYTFGQTEIFNPWSVINYFGNDCEAKTFWQATGSNDIIGHIIAEANEEICDKLTQLINGQTILSYIDTDVIYPQIKHNPSSIYSFLLMSGYLKIVKKSQLSDASVMCELALPNREITYVYNKEILQKMERMISPAITISIQEAIFSGDGIKLQRQIQTLLLQSVSSFDTAGENFYHGFMLGICALFNNYYTTSNRESGLGRYDIQLMPKSTNLPGILIELKAQPNCSEQELQNLASIALSQIKDKLYATELFTHGITTVYEYGVAFSGKHVEITTDICTL